MATAVWVIAMKPVFSPGREAAVMKNSLDRMFTDMIFFLIRIKTKLITADNENSQKL